MMAPIIPVQLPQITHGRCFTQFDLIGPVKTPYRLAIRNAAPTGNTYQSLLGDPELSRMSRLLSWSLPHLCIKVDHGGTIHCIVGNDEDWRCHLQPRGGPR
jgi:hypothetical protein